MCLNVFIDAGRSEHPGGGAAPAPHIFADQLSLFKKLASPRFSDIPPELEQLGLPNSGDNEKLIRKSKVPRENQFFFCLLSKLVHFEINIVY